MLTDEKRLIDKVNQGRRGQKTKDGGGLPKVDLVSIHQASGIDRWNTMVISVSGFYGLFRHCQGFSTDIQEYSIDSKFEYYVC